MEINRGEEDSLRELMRREERADHRAIVLVGLITLGAFFGGYGLHVWESWRAKNVYEWCVSHRVSENGRVYCDVTRFGQYRVGDEL